MISFFNMPPVMPHQTLQGVPGRVFKESELPGMPRRIFHKKKKKARCRGFHCRCYEGESVGFMSLLLQTFLYSREL